MEGCGEAVDGDTDLGHRVAVADGDGVILFNGFEVDGDAEGGADFVLPAVASPGGQFARKCASLGCVPRPAELRW